MRINKYLALKKYCTRREADEWIAKKLVYVNGVHAVIGQQVLEADKVTVKGRQKKFKYFAYNKPVGIVTHSPQAGEQEIKDIFPIKGVYPMGRLDKDSSGLLILTDDGRVTEALLNPSHDHDKEYLVQTLDELPTNFKNKMEKGVDIGDYVTKPCTVKIISKREFAITLTEGKNRQIRRMCGAFGQSVEVLVRTRILNIKLGNIKSGEHRPIEGTELATFLNTLEIPTA